jgi:hypothetical protein
MFSAFRDYNIGIDKGFRYNLNNPFMSKLSNQLIDRPVIIGALIIAIFLGILTLLGLSLIASQLQTTNSQRVYITLIPPSSVIEDHAQPTQTITALNNSTNPSGVFPKDSQVTVEGTGKDGLRVHSDAGINFPTLFLAQDGDKFIILDGPRLADGYAWWKVIIANNNNIEGWVVQDFITMVAN